MLIFYSEMIRLLAVDAKILWYLYTILYLEIRSSGDFGGEHTFNLLTNAANL